MRNAHCEVDSLYLVPNSARWADFSRIWKHTNKQEARHAWQITRWQTCHFSTKARSIRGWPKISKVVTTDYYVHALNIKLPTNQHHQNDNNNNNNNNNNDNNNNNNDDNNNNINNKDTNNTTGVKGLPGRVTIPLIIKGKGNITTHLKLHQRHLLWNNVQFQHMSTQTTVSWISSSIFRESASRWSCLTSGAASAPCRPIMAESGSSVLSSVFSAFTELSCWMIMARVAEPRCDMDEL